MQGRTAWRTLGITATADVGAVRRAYADALRALDVDADPAGFSRLREAREIALRLARSMAEGVPQEEASDEAEPDAERSLPAIDFVETRAPILDRVPPPGAIEVAQPPSPDPWRFQPPVGPVGETIDLPLDHTRLRLDAPSLDRAPVIGEITQAPTTDHFDAAYRMILRLLHPDDQARYTPLTSDENARLDTALDTVLRDPRLDELAFHADAERWFGDVLGDAIPRSDPVLYRVAERLGWLAVRERIGLAPATERILDRIDMLVFVTAVERPDHRLHRAWRELTTPAIETSRRNLTISRKRMNELLTLIRTRHSEAEEYLDAYRVGMWQRKSSAGGGGSWWLGGVLGFMLLRVLISLNQPSTEPVPMDPVPSIQTDPALEPVPAIDPKGPKLAAGQSEPLRELTGDLDLALLSIADGLTAGLVQQENPELYERLAQRWRTAKAADTTIAKFLVDTRRYLHDLLNVALRRANFDDIAAWRAQELVELKAAESQGTDECDRYMKGDFDPEPFVSELSRRNRPMLIRRILLADTGTISSGDAGARTFQIPAPVVEAVKASTKFDDKTLDAVFRGQGTADARCDVRKALLQAAIELPRADSLDLLRQM